MITVSIICYSIEHDKSKFTGTLLEHLKMFHRKNYERAMEISNKSFKAARGEFYG